MVSIPDVPDASAALLSGLLDVMPGWAGSVMEPAGELLLVAVFAVWLRLWTAARRSRSAAAGTALSVPVAVALAWAVSEFAKQVTRVDRPCRLLDDLPGWTDCPVPGDWSFPSNHAAIAGALSVGVAVTARQVRARVAAASALLGGALTAVSRVLAGSHFPHDVVAGLVLGGMVAFVTVTVIGRLAVPAGSVAGRRRDRDR